MKAAQRRKKRSLLLAGPAGGGKTTLGAYAASITGLPLVDVYQSIICPEFSRVTGIPLQKLLHEQTKDVYRPSVTAHSIFRMETDPSCWARRAREIGPQVNVSMRTGLDEVILRPTGYLIYVHTTFETAKSRRPELTKEAWEGLLEGFFSTRPLHSFDAWIDNNRPLQSVQKDLRDICREFGLLPTERSVLQPEPTHQAMILQPA